MSKLLLRQFTDLLCIWAYVGQIRVDRLMESDGEAIELEPRFCNVFSNARDRIGRAWADRGGLTSYAAHCQAVCEPFDHVTVHPDAWAVVTPRSSLGAHIFLAAVRKLEADGEVEAGAFRRACWSFRLAFFGEGRDIGLRAVQYQVAESLKLPIATIESCLATSAAHAELAADFDLAAKLDVRMSPTLVLDEGRQRLAGNVGYRVIEANVRELLRTRGADEASWC